MVGNNILKRPIHICLNKLNNKYYKTIKQFLVINSILRRKSRLNNMQFSILKRRFSTTDNSHRSK